MRVTLGKEGCTKSWQANFPEVTSCIHCKAESRIAFVAHEGMEEKYLKIGRGKCVCEIHKNDPKGDGYWLHDFCAVAIYFCKKCLDVTALYNQG